MLGVFMGILGIVAAADLDPMDSLESMMSAFDGEGRRLGGRQELRKEMMAAHICHARCGSDVACHKTCPNPWKPLIEACRQVPSIKKCREEKKETCPSFVVDWIQEEFESHPEAVLLRAERVCPRLEKAHACHHACGFDDMTCHRTCPRVWDHFKDEDEGLRPDADGCYDKGKYGVWCPKGSAWYCKTNCKEEDKELEADAKGCYDKGEHGVWCPKGDRWHCVKNCKDEEKKLIPDGKGCYDKGVHGVWCPKGDAWYCVKNCKDEEQKPKPDAKGCYDKGKYGVWCPKGDAWYCVKNCKDEEKKLKPDAKGCYDKGDYGVWCPKGDAWYCVKNCKDEEKKLKPDAKGCYDKGKYGVWCPKGDAWYCVKNCKDEEKKLKMDAGGCYDKGDYGVWCPKGDGWKCVKNCKKDDKAVAKADPRGCWVTRFAKILYNQFKSFVSDLPEVKEMSRDMVTKGIVV